MIYFDQLVDKQQQKLRNKIEYDDEEDEQNRNKINARSKKAQSSRNNEIEKEANIANLSIEYVDGSCQEDDDESQMQSAQKAEVQSTAAKPTS
jgi:hypothetical protein